MKLHFVLLEEAGAKQVGNDRGDATNPFDVLRAPPMIAIIGVLHENPSVFPQGAFLTELQERRTGNV